MIGGARPMTLIELDGPRLTAIYARIGMGRVEVESWHTADRPTDIRPDNADEIGRWLRDELRKGEIPAARVVLVIPRGDVVLKPLSFPKPAEGEISDADLGGMVRLQMSRQLTLTTGETPIDYVPIRGAASGGVEVLAGALPGDRAAWWAQVREASGIKVRRIALRCLGVGAVLGDLSVRREGAVLGVALGPAATDLVVVEHGGVVTSRAIGFVRPDDPGGFDVFAERIAVEARRTIGSFRAGRSGTGVEGVCVLGEGDLCERVAQKCGAALETQGETIPLGPTVRVPAGMPATMRSDAAALLGLALEEVQERVSLDFANPRKPPDVQARIRQGVLAGVLGMIVLGGAFWVWADQQLGEMRRTLAALRAEESDLRSKADRFTRERVRIGHVEALHASRVDWLSHVAHVTGIMPEPGPAILDDLRARAVVAPTFTPSERGAFPAGTWGASLGVTIDLEGSITSRQVASDLREALLAAGGYAVESRGADVPERFSLQLRSTSPRGPTRSMPANGNGPATGAGNGAARAPAKGDRS
jgi:Tfp pilus assembly PilM family ATPase